MLLLHNNVVITSIHCHNAILSNISETIPSWSLENSEEMFPLNYKYASCRPVHYIVLPVYLYIPHRWVVFFLRSCFRCLLPFLSINLTLSNVRINFEFYFIRSLFYNVSVPLPYHRSHGIHDAKQKIVNNNEILVSEN